MALHAFAHPYSSLVLTVQFGAGAQPIPTGLRLWQFVLNWWCAWHEPIAAEPVKEMQPATAWRQAAFYDHPVLFLFKCAFHSNWNVQIKGGEKATQPAPFTREWPCNFRLWQSGKRLERGVNSVLLSRPTDWLSFLCHLHPGACVARILIPAHIWSVILMYSLAAPWNSQDCAAYIKCLSARLAINYFFNKTCCTIKCALNMHLIIIINHVFLDFVWRKKRFKDGLLKQTCQECEVSSTSVFLTHSTWGGECFSVLVLLEPVSW